MISVAHGQNLLIHFPCSKSLTSDLRTINYMHHERNQIIKYSSQQQKTLKVLLQEVDSNWEGNFNKVVQKVILIFFKKSYFLGLRVSLRFEGK